MIVNDFGDYYELIDQHEHARVSWCLAKEWGDAALEKEPLYEEVLQAIRHHDRAWIPLDQSPTINMEKGAPHSFTDYPETKKLAAYQKGIEEVTAMHKYSGLLVSLHYSSFFGESSSKEGQIFLRSEEKRQKWLRKELIEEEMEGRKEEWHLSLLQFCDDLSLYACMNKPGAAKEEEINWFKHGFRHTFPFLNEDVIYPLYRTNQEITLQPFPLKRRVTVSIQGKKVRKRTIERDGLEIAFANAESCERVLTFC
ncbi:DUF3891 family protein [Alteribacillus iranensis]|uniref:DUF3891 domain-containing protein n=1 Tax=Alteribacillus iranensis TaxID=930128 RepID=A0A1I1ZTA2_9BACI|nr:DUF3891 family protein [Alteribacillus iranensis]SFE35014.1 Protein of unknown function [Alteribacillus iranensis]